MVLVFRISGPVTPLSKLYSHSCNSDISMAICLSPNGLFDGQVVGHLGHRAMAEPPFERCMSSSRQTARPYISAAQLYGRGGAFLICAREGGAGWWVEPWIFDRG
ncbi:hypothetical protein ACH5RR_018320 [Cinchona calisaya]|uniref:SET domain-containing protein n=1 Tax=Cinchona calisaya TaxID=153742 RepID=A0ABD2ZL83_9GENT